MFLSGKHELFILFGTFAGGLAVGLVFDIFRIYRKNFKIAALLVWLQDIIMWAAMLAVVYITLFITNSAKLRWYEFAGFGIGVLVYMVTLSSFVIAVSGAVISFFKKLFCAVFKVIFAPFKWIYKLISPPIFRVLKWAKSKIKASVRRKKFNFLRFYRVFKKI